LLYPLVLTFDGSTTTEAGIRQKLEENARPSILDEFEAGNLANRQRIMALARSAFSANVAGVKGTPSGKHMEFLMTTTFLFAGITPLRENAANNSRMFNIELLAHDSDEKKGKKIEETSRKFTNVQTSWCKDRINEIEEVVKSLPLFHVALPSIDSRARDNLAIIFAASFVALHGKTPSEAEASSWIDRYQSLVFDHIENHEQNDSQDALSHLLSHQVHGDTLWQHIAIGEWQAKMEPERDDKTDLQRYGLRLSDGKLWVSGSHSYLMKVYQNSKWPEGGWMSQLKRLPNTVVERKYFQGQQQWSVGIPVEDLKLSEAMELTSRV